MIRKIKYSKYIESAEEDDSLLVPKHIWAATLENPTQEGQYLSESDFNNIQSKLCDSIDLNNYSSRADAKQKLEERASNLGIIEYFVLRAVIAWLIEVLLDSIFGTEES